MRAGSRRSGDPVEITSGGRAEGVQDAGAGVERPDPAAADDRATWGLTTIFRPGFRPPTWWSCWTSRSPAARGAHCAARGSRPSSGGGSGSIADGACPEFRRQSW